MHLSGKFKLKSSIIALMLIISANALGIQYNFRQLEIKQGVSLVHDIVRDTHGYLWIANGFQGLMKNNSYATEVFIHSQEDSLSLSSNEVTCLHIDASNKLWIGTINGLNKYDESTNSFVRYFHNNKAYTGIDNHIISILSDEKGGLWVLLKNALYYFDSQNNSFNLVELPDRLDQYNFSSIVQDTDGNFWMATEEPDLIKFNFKINTFNVYTNLNLKQGEPVIKKMHIDQNGGMWITTRGAGLMSFNTKTKKFTNYNYDSDGNGTNSQYLLDILSLNKDTLLIASDQGGINLLNIKTKRFSYITKENSSLNSNGIFNIYKDNEGIIWVGTSRNGVLYNNPHSLPFVNYSEKSDQLKEKGANIIGCFFEDDKGNTWVGTDGNGIKVLNKNFEEIEHFTTKNTSWLNSNVIRNIFKDKNGTITISSWSNLLSFYRDEKRSKRLNDKISKHLLNGSLWGVYLDSQQRYWCEEPNGQLSVFNKNGEFIRCILPKATKMLNNFTKVLEDKNQTYYISNHLGLFKLKGIDGTPEKMDDSYRIGAFCVSDNMIAIGGIESGVKLIDKEGNEIKRFTQSNGLSSNFIKSVEFDDNGNIWVSTLKGLNFINCKDFSVIPFYTSDGIIDNHFFVQSQLKSKGGRIFMGTYNGFVVFNPDSIKLTATDSKVNIEKITIYSDYKLQNVTEHRYPTNDTINLNWKERMFIVDFSSINYNNPEKIKYQYKLEGFNTNWINTTFNKRSATYTNLKPGNYIFKVKATDPFGNWGREEKDLKIVIHPPFWRTKIWYIAIAILFIGLVLLLIRLRLNSLIKAKWRLELKVEERTKIISEQNKELEMHRNQLEDMVRERTEKLNDARKRAEESDQLKMRFLANMSHEIRTPMNAIIGFSNILQNDELPNDLQKEYLGIINTNAESLLMLVGDIIDISKIEANQLNVICQNVNVVGILEEVINNFKGIINSDEIELSLKNELNSNELVVYTDPYRFKQIVNNLVNNAIKYAERGLVEIGVYKDKGNCIVYVQDEGPGIPKNYQKQIFDTFHTLEETDKRAKRGVGLGLSISKNLAGLLNINLTLESEIGKGAKFTLTLPLNDTH